MVKTVRKKLEEQQCLRNRQRNLQKKIIKVKRKIDHNYIERMY